MNKTLWVLALITFSGLSQGSPLKINGMFIDKDHNFIPSYEGINGVDAVGKIKTIKTRDDTIFFDIQGRVIKEISILGIMKNIDIYTYKGNSHLPVVKNNEAIWEGGGSNTTTKYQRDSYGRLISSEYNDNTTSRTWRDFNDGHSYTLKTPQFGVMDRYFNKDGLIVRDENSNAPALLCLDNTNKPYKCPPGTTTNTTVQKWKYTYNEKNPQLISEWYKTDSSGYDEYKGYYGDGYLWQHSTQLGNGNWKIKRYKNYKFDKVGNWVDREVCEVWDEGNTLKNCLSEKRTFTYY